MPVIDKRQPRPRRPAEEPHPPAPYQIHRAAFTDSEGPAPAVVAVDAQPRARDVTFGGGTKIATIIIDPAGLATSVRRKTHPR